MAAKNAGDGLSMLSTIENATNDVTDMLQRVRELAVQAVNDTNSTEDRGYLQTEVTQLVAEIDRVANDTQYNGRNVFVDFVGTGSGESAVAGGKIQVGTEANQTIDFTIDSISSTALGVNSIDISTGASAT